MAQEFTIDKLIGSILDPELLIKIQGKKVLLYDLTVQTKDLMEYFFRHDIYITGFFLSYEHKNYADIKYFNKPMFYPDELDGSEIIIDPFGEHIKELKALTGCAVHSMYPPPPHLIILDQ